jgi:hypothetical protein
METFEMRMGRTLLLFTPQQLQLVVMKPFYLTPSLEADSHSSDQEILPPFYENCSSITL